MDNHEYILTSSGELYHAWLGKGKEADDHKYIKREWKKGKWVYTYPSEKKTDNNATANKTVRDTDDLLSSTKVINIGGKKTEVYYRGKLDRALDAAKQRKEERSEKWDNFVEKMTPKPSNTDKKEKTSDRKGLISKAKDALGFDEREEYKNAKTNKDSAVESRKAASDEYNAVRDIAYEDYKITEDEERRIDKARTDFINADNASRKAGKEYLEISEEFFKTPIGKLSKKMNEFAETIKEHFDKPTDVFEELTNDSEVGERERYAKEKEIRKREGLLKEQLSHLESPIDGLKQKEVYTYPDEDMGLINPNYESGSLYDENCAYCSIAYDLRRRGYDVEASAEINQEGLSVSDIIKLYDGEDQLLSFGGEIVGGFNIIGQRIGIHSIEYNKKSMTRFTYLVEDCGDGARGILNVSWDSGGGHAIAWEVENGRAIFRDCQTNERVNLDEWAEYGFAYDAIRLDTATPKPEVKKYVRNRS